jgi:1-aminocyclopropane-1-carboxylate deaminase/D-cysteine desulfhydrase-like pyridoxal-dependent ACC family enzyme
MKKLLKYYFFAVLLILSNSIYAQAITSKKYDLKDVILISKALDYYLAHNQLRIDMPVAYIEYINENELTIHFSSGDINPAYDGSKSGNHFFSIKLTKKNGEWIPNKITGVR